jgi:hypothetical protein
MQTLSTMTVTGALAAMALLVGGGPAGAQSRTIQGESTTVTATIEAIDAGTRTLTVKNADGTYENLVAPAAMTRFPELKVGDKITARYYENVVVRLKKPGEAAVDMDAAAVTKNAGAPGATAATQRTMTVTVTAKDPKTSAVTVRGPNNYNYSRRVKDKKVFEGLKVGDQLEMTWTDALLISFDPPKN